MMSRPRFQPVALGFTIVAIILLIVVTFCVKSVFFFKASITEGKFNGSIKFGTLGYCVELANGTTTCSTPSVGYNPGKFSPFHPPSVAEVQFGPVLAQLLGTES